MLEYTHNIDFEYGDQKLSGEVEFNDDGIATVKFSNSPEMETGESMAINQIIDLMKTVTHQFGAIKKIEIVEKK